MILLVIVGRPIFSQALNEFSGTTWKASFPLLLPSAWHASDVLVNKVILAGGAYQELLTATRALTVHGHGALRGLKTVISRPVPNYAYRVYLSGIAVESFVESFEEYEHCSGICLWCDIQK